MEVHVSLLGRRDLAGEIYGQLRAAIVAGRLRAGEPLPPTRELARRLSVSRGTVAVAYDRLSGEGFVTSRVGADAYVSELVARLAPWGSLGRPARSCVPVATRATGIHAIGLARRRSGADPVSRWSRPEPR